MLSVERRIEIMQQMRDYYGDDLVEGWVDLFGYDLQKSDDDWWLLAEDHDEVCGVDNVRNGHGMWTGIKNETKQWVHKNADQMHDVLWQLADNQNLTVWALLESYDMKDECSWVLESILKCENNNHDLPRLIGWFVGNDMVHYYQGLAQE